MSVLTHAVPSSAPASMGPLRVGGSGHENGSGGGGGSSVTIKLAYNSSVHRFIVPELWLHSVTSVSQVVAKPSPSVAASGVGPWQRLMVLLRRTFKFTPAQANSIFVYCEDADDDFVVPITNDGELRQSVELTQSGSGTNKTLKLFISHDAPASSPLPSPLAAPAAASVGRPQPPALALAAAQPPLIVRATSGAPPVAVSSSVDDKQNHPNGVDTDAALAAAAAADDAATAAALEGAEIVEAEEDSGERGFGNVSGAFIAVTDYFAGGAGAASTAGTAAALTPAVAASTLSAASPPISPAAGAAAANEVQLTPGWGLIQVLDSHFDAVPPPARNGQAARAPADAKHTAAAPSVAAAASAVPSATDPFPRALSNPRRPTLAAFAAAPSSTSSRTANGGRKAAVAWATERIAALPFVSPAAATAPNGAVGAVISNGLFAGASASRAAVPPSAAPALSALSGVNARFIATPKTLPDGLVVATRSSSSAVAPIAPPPIVQHWTFRNTGTRAWPAPTRLVYCHGNVHDSAFPPVAIPSIAPGQQVTIALTVHLPAGASGRYWGVYRLCATVAATAGATVAGSGVRAGDDQDTGRFGEAVWLDVTAKSESQLALERVTGAAKRIVFEPLRR